MDIGLILLTLACFVGGILMSRWQARRHLRNHANDQMAREAEKELARRVLEKVASKNGGGLDNERTRELIREAVAKHKSKADLGA